MHSNSYSTQGLCCCTGTENFNLWGYPVLKLAVHPYLTCMSDWCTKTIALLKHIDLQKNKFWIHVALEFPTLWVHCRQLPLQNVLIICIFIHSPWHWPSDASGSSEWPDHLQLCGVWIQGPGPACSAFLPAWLAVSRWWVFAPLYYTTLLLFMHEKIQLSCFLKT